MVASVSGSSSSSVADQSPGDSDEDRIAALTKEKQALHALLKEYEKNFQAKHHRAVFSHDDIVPVAREFERYQVRDTCRLRATPFPLNNAHRSACVCVYVPAGGETAARHFTAQVAAPTELKPCR